MYDHLEVKDRIIKVATDLFHKQGYSDTGINQIIEEANIAKASLYYHFATKDELCIAYLQQRHRDWNSSLESYISRKRNKALAAFDFLLDDNEQSDYRGCSFLNILPETSPDKKNIYREIQSHKKALLLFFENQLGGDKPELAYAIYSLFENAIIESQMHRSQEPVLKLKKIAASLIQNNSL